MALVLLTGCNESLVSDAAEQEQVMFYTALPGGMMTRSARTDFEESMDGYKAVTGAYEFTVGMYESGNLVGQSVYSR